MRAEQAIVDSTRAPDVGKPAAGAPVRRLGVVARAKFGCLRGFLWAWSSVFSLKGLYVLGRFFGTLEFMINFRRRARYRKELKRIFPKGLTRRRERKIVREYFRRTRCDKMLYVIFDRIPKEKIVKRIRFRGREHLDSALERGNGIYVMLSHHGSHHVAGLLMALLGYKCAGVRDRNEGASRVYMQQKYAATFPEFAAVRVLYADTFPREIYRCFQENRVVGTALDVGRIRGLALKTCAVEYFGEKREFLIGTLQIALRCKATVAQAFVVSRRNFYFRLIVQPPLHIPAEEGKEDPELIRDIMQNYAHGIESHVRKHPDHVSRV